MGKKYDDWKDQQRICSELRDKGMEIKRMLDSYKEVLAQEPNSAIAKKNVENLQSALDDIVRQARQQGCDK